MFGNDALLALLVTGVAIIGLCSLPAVSAVVTRLSKRDARQEIYADDDGTATPESMKAFSAKLPKAAILFIAAHGLPISILLTLLSRHDPSTTLKALILIAASWVGTKAQSYFVCDAESL